MKIKESRGRKIFKAFNYTFLALLGIATFYPFWYVLIASFNTGRDFMRGGVWIWPRAFTLENYQMAFVMILTMPIVVIYPFLQKYYVKGVMVGSVKG